MTSPVSVQLSCDRRNRTGRIDVSRVLRLPAPTHRPLLTCDLASGTDRVVTVADPFPVSCDGQLFVLAEIEGTRQNGAYFKKLGAFAFDDNLASAEYLGELWPADDGEYSFPYVLRDGNRMLLVPDVNTPGTPTDKRFRIYQTSCASFPFGWRLLVETPLPGAPRPSDKVLFADQGRWWLWVSDSSDGGKLLLFTSDDLLQWTPHPQNPLLHRPAWERAANRVLPLTLFRVRPWRLGGGVVQLDQRPVLFLQHMYRRRIYGEAVTALSVTHLSEYKAGFRFDRTPIVQADEQIPWRSMAAHHVAFARHHDNIVVATDGFDGETWSTDVQRLDHAAVDRLSLCGERAE